MVAQTLLTGASEPELLVFNTLIRLGLVHGVDFTFQSKQFGGRILKGGYVLDFLFENPPGLAINVQGIYYHYEQGSAIQQNDILTQIALASIGITLIFIDEDDVLDDPEFYVRAALNFQDLSRNSGRL